jgi:hypothetical protein
MRRRAPDAQFLEKAGLSQISNAGSSTNTGLAHPAPSAGKAKAGRNSIALS